MEPVTSLREILEMDAKESWRNYVRATDVWVQIDWDNGSGKEATANKYKVYFLQEVAKISLAVHLDRIEKELW